MGSHTRATPTTSTGIGEITMSTPTARVADRRLTVDDLSPDQREVYNAICNWCNGANPPMDMSNGNLLTCGGFAGCLSGDTIVNYNRGSRINVRPITMRDLYLKFNGFIGSGRGAAQRWVDLTMPTFMPSVWPDNTVARNRVVAVFESGVKPVVRVDFNDGQHLVLTVDHPIATPNGEFVEAGALVVGNKVLAQGSMKCAEGKGRRPINMRPPRIIVNTKYHPGPIKTVVCNGVEYDYVRVARARLVVEAAMNDISYEEFVHALKHNAGASEKFKYLPTGRVVDVHHVDEDTLNDDISNLEVLPHAEHARLHGGENERHFRKNYFREVKVTRIRKAGEEMTYDVQMEPPANNFVANGIFVHNTGKSSILGVFAAETDLQVAYVSFTGRASSVLGRKLKACGAVTTDKTFTNSQRILEGRFGHLFSEDATASFCGTLHRLLYRPLINEKTDELLGWSRRESLDRQYDLIVVDEASMISDEILLDLKTHQIPILAVGDHGQLPPVAASGDLMQNPMLRLEKIHRQAESNPIIALSKVIRETGQLDKSLADGKRIRFALKSDLQLVLEAAYECDKPIDVGVLCWTNKVRVRLNGAARKAQGFTGPPRKGEVVICLRNKPPVYNGMRGLLMKDAVEWDSKGGPNFGLQPWHLNARIEFAEEGIEANDYTLCAPQFMRETSFKDLEELQARGISVERVSDAGSLFDFGYALTGHKAQGSQFDHVIIYLDRPQKPWDDDYKRWIYTCCTRASERLTILL
jgi:exodeoxyribonuclease V